MKKKPNNAPSRDLYQAVTDRIVAALEAGTRPWQKRWNNVAGSPGGLQLRSNGAEYRGINQLLLSLTSMECGYGSPYWLTFKQALELGGNVRKGERSTEIVFYKKLTVEDRDAPEGEGREKQIPMLRSYRVFNADQCEGLPERYSAKLEPVTVADTKKRDEAAEAALRSSGAEIREGGNRACYSPGHDVVLMPTFAQFLDVGAYLATLAHELTHWTGHKSRLDRLKLTPFGTPEYAREELVAEIGSAFVCARLGIAGEHIDNHAAYLASWLKVLRGDKRAIFKAAALAQTAADLVLANAGTGAAELEEESEEEIAPAEPVPALAAYRAQLELIPNDDKRAMVETFTSFARNVSEGSIAA
jgi:antirestriction protein ArdC